MKLKYYYYSFYITKFIIFCFQLGITLFFLYWTFNYCRATWENFTQPIFDMINHGASYDYHSHLSWVMPILKQSIYLIVSLVILAILKYAVVNLPFHKGTIVQYFKDKEIDPIFANQITEYLLWHKHISHQTFFDIYKEAIYQNSVLNYHQKNKEVYQFISLFQSNTTRYKQLESLQKSTNTNTKESDKIE